VNQKVLLDVIKEVGLEVSTRKTKFMVMYRRQNAGQYLNLLRHKKTFENMYISHIWKRQ